MNRNVLLLWAALAVCGCGGKKDDVMKAPIRVETELMLSSPSDGNQAYVGIVEEKEGTAVSFTSMGVVRRVLVEEGQTVSRGQLIAEMDDSQARNLLSGAEAQMAQADDALKRYGMLHDAGSLPEVQWVEIQSKVAQARAQLEVARKNLADCRLTAPVSGVIGKKLIKAGETALPSQAVVTILDISMVKVRVAVPEKDFADMGTSVRANVRVDAAGVDVAGGRIEKGVQADVLTHTYDVRVSVANHDRALLPGMVASVSFLTGESSDTVARTLPVTAVRRSTDGSLFVWIVGADSTARRAKVTVGETRGNRIVIAEGPDTGQRVVTEGYQKLSEGTRVVY